jgi:putative phosphoesterase
MRYLILSDVHANLEAFEAVLSATAGESIDHIVFLGDIVGYGAEPNEAVDRLKQLNPSAVIRGNHDKVIAGIEEPSRFQKLARMSAVWSRTQMTPDNVVYLQRMSQGPVVLEESGIQAAHGSPHNEDFYILRDRDANQILRSIQSWITFFGHTHIPVIYSSSAGFSVCYPEGEQFHYTLSRENRYLINPGSVGQPRDLNPKASFTILDTEEDTICIRRVEYDICGAQDKIRRAGLPVWHANRLAFGR